MYTDWREGGFTMHNVLEIAKLFKVAGKTRRFIILTLLRCPFDALHTVLQASFLKFAFSAINKGNKNELFHACTLFGIGSMLLFLYNGTVWTLICNLCYKMGGHNTTKIIQAFFLLIFAAN